MKFISLLQTLQRTTKFKNTSNQKIWNRFLVNNTKPNVGDEVNGKLPKVNLFGIREKLNKPEDFVTLTKESIHNINFIRTFLRHHHNHLSYSQKLIYFDNISSELCNVIDAAELCRNIHSDANFHDVAEQTFAHVSDLIIDLNADVNLFTVLQEIIDNAQVIPRNGTVSKNADPMKTISEEEFNFGNDLYTDYRLEGIHLIKKSRETGSKEDEIMKQIRTDIVTTESSYSLNVRNQSVRSATNNIATIGPFDLDQPDQEIEFDNLSSWVKSTNPTSTQLFDRSSNKGFFTVPSNHNYLSPLLSGINNENIRKSIYLEMICQPFSNITPFSQLLKHRQSISNILSFPSYSHKTLAKHIYHSPKDIQYLLQLVSKELASTTKQELNTLLNFKKDLLSFQVEQLEELKRQQQQNQSPSLLSRFFKNSTEEQTITGHSTSFDSVRLEPWDLAFLQSTYQQSMNEESDDEAFPSSSRGNISEYLSLPNAIQSLQMICKEVFQLDLIEETFTTDELWINLSAGKSPQQMGLYKFRVYDQNKNSNRQFLGNIYFDLFQRESKFTGVAHFIIRCGCDKINFHTMTNESVKFTAYDAENDKKNIPKTIPEVIAFLKEKQFFVEHQPPIAYLVFNFESRSDQNKNSNKPLLLSLAQLESLYHEFGHALHSLLSNTKFQHVSGTRGSTDFIEIPSHLMEYFAREPSVIQKWAKHYQTNQPIPLELLKNGLKKRQSFIGLDYQRQILFGAADQHLFSSWTDFNGLSDETIFLKSLEQVSKIQEEYTMLPLASVQSLQDQINPEDYELNPTTTPLKIAIGQNLTNLPSMWLLNHAHFINYGASYYSYILARMYSAQIWYQLLAKDPLSKDAGKLIRNELLAYGSSKVPKTILDDLLGKSLDPSFFISSITNKPK